MGNKAEASEPGRPNAKSANIFLDRDDLLQLSVLRRFGGMNYIADPRLGLTIPNHMMNNDLRATLDELSASGRFKVSNKTPRNVIAPSKAGNTVVRPQVDDKSVLAAFAEVNPLALDPILDLVSTFGSKLRSVNLFPNYSSRKLKGLVIDLDPGTDRWWKNIARLNWPVGRGIITAALPVGAEEFIDQSPDILKKIQLIGMSSEKAIKYIRFYYDDRGQVFMTVSAGPTKDERGDITSQLSNTNRPGQAKNLLREIYKELISRRHTLINHLAEEMGLAGCPEVMSDAPYVALDVDRGQAVSGGVGMRSHLLPYSRRDDGLVIHADESDNIHPLGMKRAETKKELPKFFSTQSINNWANSLNVVLDLKDLVVGYHPVK